MHFKIPALCLIAAAFLYRMFLSLLSLRSARNPMPENVKDLYDAQTYQKWQSYNRETGKLGILSSVVTTVIQMLLIAFNVYAMVTGSVQNVYLQSLLVLLIITAVDMLVGIPFSYVSTMVIEQKYGFNRSTVKTFVLDQIKGLMISAIFDGGLLLLFALIHQSMGDWILVLFTAVLIVFAAAMGFLSPVFSKIFNKFTPLPDGPLKEKLTALLEKYGYRVKTIDVMDASRRTTKSNAYFTGFGKMKTIVLYDTLLNTMDEDEVCAIFAHEMGHGLHKDTLKMQLLNLVNIGLTVVLLWLTVRDPALYKDFGFAAVNYGFALQLLSMAELPILQPLTDLLVNAVSRRAEYRADRQAVRDGYGAALSSGLKKLAKDNLADLSPSKLLVKLEYSHPPLSQRLTAIEEEGSRSQPVC